MNYVLELMGYPIPEKQRGEQPTKKSRAPALHARTPHKSAGVA